MKVAKRGSGPPAAWSEAFLNYLRTECHLSENTVHAYQRDMRRFGEWLGRRSITRLSIRELSDYVGWLHSQNLAPASIARHVISLKVFCTSDILAPRSS